MHCFFPTTSFFSQKPHANLQFLMILLALLTASTLTLRNQGTRNARLSKYTEKNDWPVLKTSWNENELSLSSPRYPTQKSKFANLLWRIHPNKSGQKRCLTRKVMRPVLSKHESKKMKTFNPQLQPEFLVTASKPCQRPTVSSQKPGSKPCILD